MYEIKIGEFYSEAATGDDVNIVKILDQVGEIDHHTMHFGSYRKSERWFSWNRIPKCPKAPGWAFWPLDKHDAIIAVFIKEVEII